MASLFVVRGRDQGKHFQLSETYYRIGRDVGSDIQLFDSEASRSHAEIRVTDDGGCELIDLDSSNGTVVNGERVRRHNLCSGDRIEIGSTLIIFTGTTHSSAIESDHDVDIVWKSEDDSRIVSSLSQAGSDSGIALPGPDGSDADRSLEVMYLTAIAVGRSDDLNEVLDRILRLVFDWVEADRGCVMLRNNDTGQLQPAARCDRQETSHLHLDRHMSISRTILDYAIEQKEGVRTSNAGDDSRFDSAVSIVQAGVREALCVPLQGRYGIVGAIYVDTYTPPGQLVSGGYKQRFNDDHLRLITAIGHQAALAIEDTFYYSALVQGERLAAMGQTVATLSHHIKNILQGIRGGSYLIEAGLNRNDTDAVRRGWGMVDRNQDRISNLVMDMLSFSKEREPTRVDGNLNETAADVLELIRARAAESDVEVVRDFDESMPLAYYDTEAIHRALLNLVSNALDAVTGQVIDEADFEADAEIHPAVSETHQPSPRITVKTRYDEFDGWLVDVIDNGPGVSPEDREAIFSPFVSRKGFRGTGLGLPVSVKIMREHGGDIQVIDIKGEPGICFRMRLPPANGSATDLGGTL